MPKKKTKEEFIKEATEKHKGKYDYSKVEYVNSKLRFVLSVLIPGIVNFGNRLITI